MPSRSPDSWPVARGALEPCAADPSLRPRRVLGETERIWPPAACNSVFAEFGLPVQWTEDSYGYWTTIGGGKERLMRLLTPELQRAVLPEDPDEQQRLISRWHRRKTEIYIDLVTSGSVPRGRGRSRR